MKERQRWQPEEDALLRAYVKQYGAKEWNLVSQRMGRALDRDAKSCLERWKNYLKPGIKKGSLTEEEQALVISLQAKYGNKWKKIASEVPGRTAKRLGKWWEVFKEKQLKEKRKVLNIQDQPASSAEESVQSKYDHILETFAEKYVQPKLKEQQHHHPFSSIIMPNISLDAPPILSLGTTTTDIAAVGAVPTTSLHPWLSSTSSSTSSSASSTVSPSVSLSLSPSEPPASPEIVYNRFLPVHQVSTLVQYIKELEEGRLNWLQHKKEATWRLSRLEQQLESEKARKRREKMEEVEAKIKSLREEEMAFLDRIESESKDQLNAIQRDADAKEAKIMEMWVGKHTKLAKFVEQMGIHRH
ncbi:transcription factor AS1-like [Aristolochia californica]|uniref:transcription factor AS1-like n=1 Tax=Aristolochia californica TaxID=171875 RepID=UPI0035DBA969